MKKDFNSTAKNLRKRAEELLRKKATDAASIPTEADYLKLIHELQVHQIELELVNEELILAKEQADSAYEKYAELYDFAPSGYFTLTKKGEISELNLHGAKMLGKDRSSLINSHFGFFIPVDARPKFISFLDGIFQDTNTHHCEVPISSNGNITFYVQLSGIISDVSDQCRVTAVDISDRIKAENDLKNSLAKYKVLIDTFPIAITVSDKAGNIVETNEKALELLGLSREEHLKRKIKGKDWKIIRTDGTTFPQDEYASVKALNENRLVENVEMGIVKSDDQITWLNVTAAPIPIQDLGVVIAYNDITGRKKTELGLRQSEERFRHVSSTTSDISYSCKSDKKGNYAIDWIVGSTERITGYTMNELKAKICWGNLVFEEDIDRFKRMVTGLNPGASGACELRLWNKNGNLVWVSSYAECINNLECPGQNIIYGGLVDITERKQAEEALHSSQILLEEIINTAPVRIFWKDRNLVYLGCNNEFARDAGFSDTKDIIGKNDYQMAWHSQAELYRNDDREVIESGMPRFNIEEPQTSPDGNKIALLTNKIPFRNSRGEVVGVLGTYMDITERKLAENALKESELFANTIANTTQALIYLYDLEKNRNIWANEAHKRFFEDAGKDSSELDFNEIAGFTHPDDFIKLVEHANELQNDTSMNNFKMEHRLKWKDTWKWMKLFVSVFKRNDKGKPIQILGALFDIDDHKKAEQDLLEAKDKAEKNELRLRIAQEVSSAGAWDWDIVNDTFYWSDEFYTLFGLHKNMQAGFKAWQEALHPDDVETAIQRIQTAVDNHTVLVNNYRIILPGNQIRWIRSTGKTTYVNNKPVRMIGLCFDFTTQKIAEIELQNAKEKAEESDRLKSAFLANMSHEIRTPMNGILGFAELLKEPELSGAQQSRYISIIEKSGARMLNTINEIIDFSKIEAGLMEVTLSETNINEQIEDIYNFFKPEADDRGLQLSYHKSLPDHEVNITSDAEKLHAILANLVKNAIKFTSKGSIEFGYHKTEVEPAEFVFYVKDTGIGIPQNRMTAIFDRFIQADISDKRAFQGSGLGLTISRSYVEMLGGKIWVESEQENLAAGKQGSSKFYFTIPCSGVPSEKAIIKTSVSEMENEVEIIPKGPLLKVLIAEDEEISDLVLTLKIRKISSEILHAKTGDDAVEICRLHPDLDLVLMDLKLPGISGLEAVRQIRIFNKDVAIVAQTAYALSGDRQKAVEAGCNDYITKPIKKEDLLRIIYRNVKKIN